MYNIDDSEIDRRLQANNKWNQSFKYDGRLQVPSPHTINGKSKGG
jgi:hypothetical protein